MTTKLIFFDIDGTLLDNRDYDQSIKERIPLSTKRAIQELKNLGHIPVIATGRWYGQVSELLKELEIEYAICSNGQEIYFCKERIYQNCINQELINQLYSQFKQEKIRIFYDSAQGIYVDSEHQEMVNRGVRPYLLSEHSPAPQKVLQLLFETPEFEKIKPYLQDLKIIKSSAFTYDVISKGVSKASGIQFLLDYLKISQTQTLAFGDEENDLEMFQKVALSVAMGNAVSFLKKEADFVTKEVWNDGILYACQYLKLF
ncbi:MAG: Cof-type HAD-IIB family hydrolase [Lactovum sp.]